MDDNPHRPSDPAEPQVPTPGATPRRGLGRGLAALIPVSASPATPAPAEVPIDRIRAGTNQPRRGFAQEPLDDLTESIRVHGVLQPIVVRAIPSDPGTYEIVAGERRWRAARAAGLQTVPVVVKAFDERASLEAALVENLQREDLNPVERARAYRSLMANHGLTQESLASRIGRSQASVANSLRVLSLPSEVLSALESGRISEGHAKALASLDSAEQVIDLWRKIEAADLSVRDTESAVRRFGIPRGIKRGVRGESRSRDTINIEQVLASRVGCPVRIVTGSRGRGEVRLQFGSLDELDRLVQLLTAAGDGRA